jgi:hypothetical protein
MKDPCKAGKCLTYSVCISKKSLSCPKFQEYLNWFISENIDQVEIETVSDKLKRHSIIWEHLNLIFPNLKKISYQSLPHSEKRRVYEKRSMQGW